MCEYAALISLVSVLHAHFQAILEEQDMLTRLKLVSWLAQPVDSGPGSTQVVIFAAIREME